MSYVSSFKLEDITISLSNFKNGFTRLLCEGKEYVLLKFEWTKGVFYIPYVKNIAEDMYWKACVGPALNRLIHSNTMMITDGWNEPLFRTSDLMPEYSSIFGRGATIYMEIEPLPILSNEAINDYMYPSELEMRSLPTELAKYGCLFLWLAGVLILRNIYESSKIISDISDAKVFALSELKNSIFFLRDYRPEYDYELPSLNTSAMLRCHNVEEIHKIFHKSGVIPYETTAYSQLILILKEIDQLLLSLIR